MTRGRPNKGVEHVAKLEGGESEKERLRAILAVFTGALSVAEASARLGVSETYFAQLRTQALRGALSSLAPHPVGRPAQKGEPDAALKEALHKSLAKLKEAETQRDALQELFNLGLGRPGESREKGGGVQREGRRKKRKR